MNEIVKQAMRVATIHLRAAKSMTLRGLEETLLVHTPGISGDNYKAVAARVLYALEDQRQIVASLEDHGWRVAWIGY